MAGSGELIIGLVVAGVAGLLLMVLAVVVVVVMVRRRRGESEPESESEAEPEPGSGSEPEPEPEPPSSLDEDEEETEDTVVTEDDGDDLDGTPAAGPRMIKRVQCPCCGSAKVTPSATAYLYCDYCGTLIDWDFRIACEASGSALPGPVYEALVDRLNPAQERALAAGDREGYRETLVQLFEAHFDACPASYSPRLGDPEYRQALLDYTVDSYLEAAFDPETKSLEKAMDAAVGALDWSDGMDVGAAGFLAMVDAFESHSRRWIELTTPLMDRFPDHTDPGLAMRMAGSIFIQGWLPYLDDRSRDQMLARFDLQGEYTELQPVDTRQTRCGGCGGPLAVVKGARRVVCEGCGRTNDIERGEITCHGCGGRVSIPVGVAHPSCPACGGDLRVDGGIPLFTDA